MRGMQIQVCEPITGIIIKTFGGEQTVEISPDTYFAVEMPARKPDAQSDLICIHTKINGERVKVFTRKNNCIRVHGVMNESRTREYGRWHKRGYIH